MNTLKKIALLLCALLLVLCPLSSCAEDALHFETGHLLQNGEKTLPDWIVKLDGAPVSFAEWRHFFLNAKTELDGGDEAYFDEKPEAEKTLLETTLSNLTLCHAVEALAAEQGISLTSAEEGELREQIKATRSELGDELYLELLNGYYLDEALYFEQLKNNALYEKTYESMISDGGTIHVTEQELADHLSEHYFCYAQIYIDFLSGEGTNVHTNTDTLISQVMQRLENGENFFAVAFSISDDHTALDYKNGMLIPKEELSEAKSDALSELSEGALSEPILENDGYYILLKMPISSAVIEENREYLLYGYTDVNGYHTNGLYENRFADLVSERAERIHIEYADCYSHVSSKSVF